MKANVRLNLSFLLCLALQPVFAVPGPEWQQGKDLVDQQNWAAAYEYSQTLMKKYPKDAYGLWLTYIATEQLAKKDATYWDISAKAAIKAANLEPARAHAHRAHAAWCLWNMKDYERLASQASKLTNAAVAQIGEHNFTLQVNYYGAAYVHIGQVNTASRFILRQMSGFSSHPAVRNVAEAVNLLVGSSAKNLPDVENWFDFLLKASAVKESEGHFLGALGQIGIVLGDMAFSRKDYTKAHFYFSSALDADRATLAARDGFVHDELRIRQIAAAWRKDNPRVQGKNVRNALMVIVPESRVDMPANADAARRFEKGDASAATLPLGKKIQQLVIPEMQRNFLYFSESVMALTNGEIEWRIKTVPLPGAKVTRTEFRTDSKYNRWIAQAKPQFIEPAISPALKGKILAADATILLWPGFNPHPEIFITNGGITEHPWTEGDAASHRALWISEGDKTFRAGGSALWYHHEFFHLIEWGYYDKPFPKDDHQCQKRSSWPGDYTGTTEFDFYEQTYRRHVLPADNLARMEWRSGKTWLYKRMIDGR